MVFISKANSSERKCLRIELNQKNEPEYNVTTKKHCSNFGTLCLIFTLLAFAFLSLGRLFCYNANEIVYVDYIKLFKRNMVAQLWENNFGSFLPNYYFYKRNAINTYPIQELNLPNPPTPSPDRCDKIEDADKFDCFPRGEVTEKDCNARGCCYVVSTSKTVPYCFYPRGFSSYKYISLNKTDREIVAVLAQQFKSPYPKDLPKLQITASLLSEEVLIVTITDEKNSRYRLPFPEMPSPSKKFSDPLYEFVLNVNSTGFKVVRKSTNKAIFDTEDVGGFIFSDQFIQISGKLPTHNIFGIGESRHRFKVGTDWRTVTLHNHDRDPTSNVNGYGSHPVYMGLESGGLAHGVYLLSTYSMDVVIQPSPAITYRVIGGPVTLGFVLGPTPTDVSSQYARIVGKPYLPPYWALGFHLCRYGYESLDDMIKVWNQTRNEAIPYDTQWTDLDYMKDQNDFTLSDKFKDLPAFVDLLHKIGMHYVILIDPGVSGDEPKGTYPPLDIGLEQDIFIKDSRGKGPLYGKVWNYKSTVFPDFTHPKSLPYWVRMIEDFHSRVKFDGAWIDMNEPSNMVDGSLTGCPSNELEVPPYVPGVEGGKLAYKTVCMSARHHELPHYAVHNVYAGLEAAATNFAMVNARDGKRALIISRASSPGLGAYSGHWTGDVHSTWDDMAQSISDMLSFSLFGIPLVGADICGFNGNTTVDLCSRWTQLGAFYPFSRNHNGKSELAQDPVSLGIADVARTALRQRYLHLPYLYTLFYEANTKGTPVIWPTFYIAPDDEKTYDLENQFLWGDGLLVAPSLDEGISFVTPYLPKGRWYYAGSPVSGIQSSGQKVAVSSPINGPVPIFYRGGRIIPGQEAGLTTTESRLNPYRLIVALDSSNVSSGSLYVDDGETYESNYNLLSFTAKQNVLQSKVESWTLNQDLLLGTVVIYGNFSSIKTVKINEQPLTFNFSPPYMVVAGPVNWNMKNPFTIVWT